MKINLNNNVLLNRMIQESIKGNQRMQKMLYDLYAETMFAVCFRYTNNKEDSQDILQEGFLKVFRNLHNFREDGSFEGWVRKIIKNTALTYLRDNKKHAHQGALNYSLEDKECSVLDKLAEKDIVNIVTTLPSGYRKIFVMHMIEGYNHREIAGILGCSEGTSKSQFYRSRKRIQECYKKSA
jgi:RNA polymerase sigma factor (sigma-70 family)